jgi:hypothetical protein
MQIVRREDAATLKDAKRRVQEMSSLDRSDYIIVNKETGRKLKIHYRRNRKATKAVRQKS